MALNKEFAFSHHADIVTKSWTYQKMTKKEMDGWFETAQSALDMGIISGTYDHRMKVLNALYAAYLKGLGYSGWNWREDESNQHPF